VPTGDNLHYPAITGVPFHEGRRPEPEPSPTEPVTFYVRRWAVPTGDNLHDPLDRRSSPLP
jgi:hypothetical protein